MAGDAEQLGAGAAFGADAGKPGASALDDVGNAGQGLDIVDDRWASENTEPSMDSMRAVSSPQM